MCYQVVFPRDLTEASNVHAKEEIVFECFINEKTESQKLKDWDRGSIASHVGLCLCASAAGTLSTRGPLPSNKMIHVERGTIVAKLPGR